MPSADINYLVPQVCGVLYGKYDLLKRMPPIEFGGEMISLVDVYDTTFADPPHRFEAGTMPIAEVIGLGKAIDYVNRYGYCAMQRRVEYLTSIAVEKLQAQPNVTIYNPHNTPVA